jgi:hypothetical protein
MRVRAFVAVAVMGGVFGIAASVSAVTRWSDVPALDPAAFEAAPAPTGLASAESWHRPARAPTQVGAAPALDASLFDPAPIGKHDAGTRLGSAERPIQANFAGSRPPQPRSPAMMPAELLMSEAPPSQALPPEALAMADPDAVRLSRPSSAAARPAAAAPKRTLEKVDLNNLSATQIARLKAHLAITPDQEEHWRPVEAALLDIAKDQQARKAAGQKGYAIPATVSQQLYWTAGPLIMNLRDDQKLAARNLARSLGLTTVASLI